MLCEPFFSVPFLITVLSILDKNVKGEKCHNVTNKVIYVLSSIEIKLNSAYDLH